MTQLRRRRYGFKISGIIIFHIPEIYSINYYRSCVLDNNTQF